MDRIRDIRPPGSPHTVHDNAPRLVERLLANAVAGPKSCLVWTGKTDRDNYGKIKVEAKDASAHRVVYQLLVGPIADGMVLDHTCHNQDTACSGGKSCLHRRCVNPYHLEVVTPRDNQLRSAHSFSGQNARKTHCPQGHPYDEANTRHKYGRRYCKECGRIRCRAYRQRLSSATKGLA